MCLWSMLDNDVFSGKAPESIINKRTNNERNVVKVLISKTSIYRTFSTCDLSWHHAKAVLLLITTAESPFYSIADRDIRDTIQYNCGQMTTKSNPGNRCGRYIAVNFGKWPLQFPNPYRIPLRERIDHGIICVKILNRYFQMKVQGTAGEKYQPVTC